MVDFLVAGQIVDKITLNSMIYYTLKHTFFW